MTIRPWYIVLLAGLLAVGVPGGGCSRTAYLDTVYAGRTVAFEPGQPNFDLEVVATVQAGEAGIDLYVGVPPASLVFLPDDDGYAAGFETVVRVLGRDGKDLVEEVADVDTVRVATYEATQTFEPYHKEERLQVPPGSYLVEVLVTDAESEKTARRRQRVDVVAVGAEHPALSRVRLEGKRGAASFAPILSLHVPAGMDSLRATVDLYNAGRLEDVRVSMRLMRFPSDTSAARPPYIFTSEPAYFRVRYNRPDTLQVTRRPLPDLDQSVALEFDLPAFSEGIYRVEVMVQDASAPPDPDGAILYQRRDFTVRAASFPRITTLDEMVEALTYLARREELEHIRAADTPAEMKRRFDAFWGSLIADRSRAANLLKLYYSRIEEANMLYSSYKEGWKTDRGMVYVLFGPPMFIDTQLDREVWRYSYDEQDLIGAFVFSRRRLYASEGMFEAYLLEREPFYEAAWRRALRRWRRGDVL